MASIFRQRVIRFKKFEKLRWYETNKMDFGGRFGHAMCYHKPQNRVYVFGGINENKAMLNDLRYFCMRTRTWNLEVYESPERDGPEAMSFASLVSYKDSLILFGLFPNDCASSFRILVLDVPSRRWSTVYRNKPEEVVGNTFGHSAVVMEGKVIYFGGMTRNGIPCNRMFIYFPDTMAVQVVELENPPSPRVLSALAVLDSTRLLLVGGRTGIQPPFESYQDAFIVKFLDEEFKTATCTTLPIENPAAYPHSVYANSNTSDKMIIVSEPRDCTKVNLDSFYLRQLFGYDFSSERFVEVRHCKILTFLCLCRTTQDDVDQMDYDVYPRPQAGDRFISTDKVYKKKIDNRYHLFAPQYLDIHDTMKLVWRDTVEMVQHQRDFIMYPHDHFCIMLWFTKYHPLEECGNGQRCSSSCYRVGACIYRRMKELYRTEDEAFLLKLLKWTYHLHSLTSGRSILNGPYVPMPFDAQVYYETPIGEVFPLERIIEFQMTIPVTRALIDVPLTSTFYTVDLDYVRENERIAFKQQLVPFNAPLLQQYAPIVVAGPEFFTCGGADPLTNVVTAERVIISNKTYTGY